MARKVIKDSLVHNVWIPNCGCIMEPADVNPDYYQDNGTPTCPECGSDFEYSHTEIEL